MSDETGGGAADPSLKLERVGCPAPLCGAVFEIPAVRLGRNIYCIECGRRMTARPAGPAARPRARAAEGASGPGAQVERLPLAAILDDIRSLWNVGSIFRSADGCGVEKLWLAGITGAPPRAEITRTALGAEEQVAWEYRSDVLEAIDAGKAPGRLLGFVEPRGQRAVQSVAHPRRLAGARHAGYAREAAEWHAQRHVLEIVLAAAAQHERVAADRPACRCQLYPAGAGQEGTGQRLGVVLDLARRSRRDHGAPVDTRAGTHVDDVVGAPDGGLVMLDHQNAVADVAEPLEARE